MLPLFRISCLFVVLLLICSNCGVSGISLLDSSFSCDSSVSVSAFCPYVTCTAYGSLWCQGDNVTDCMNRGYPSTTTGITIIPYLSRIKQSNGNLTNVTIGWAQSVIPMPQSFSLIHYHVNPRNWSQFEHVHEFVWTVDSPERGFYTYEVDKTNYPHGYPVKELDFFGVYYSVDMSIASTPLSEHSKHTIAVLPKKTTKGDYDTFIQLDSIGILMQLHVIQQIPCPSSSSSSSSSSSAQPQPQPHSSTGPQLQPETTQPSIAVVGIVVGAASVLVIVIFGFCCYWMTRSRHTQPINQPLLTHE